MVDPTWYMDSGANQHMAYNQKDDTELPLEEFIYLDENRHQSIGGKRNVLISLNNGKNIIIPDVLLVVLYIRICFR